MAFRVGVRKLKAMSSVYECLDVIEGMREREPDEEPYPPPVRFVLPSSSSTLS